jgi:photosystem II stability/assembly factor-like uncharacterized protein
MKRLALFFIFNVCWLSLVSAQINFGPARPGPEGSFVRPFAEDSLGNLYVGGSGLFRSTDGGNSWVCINPGLSPNCLAINRSGHIFAGMGSGGILNRSTDGGVSWVPIGMGIIGQAVLSLTLDSFGNIYAGSNYGLYFSSDNGATFTQFQALPPNYVYDLLINADGTLLAGTGAGIFSSTDRGVTWTYLATSSVNAFALKKTANGNYFEASNQGVFQSTDHGATWAKILTLYDATYLVTLNGTDLYCSTYSSGIYRSTNNGQSWEAVNNGLTQKDIVSMFVRPNGDLFAGTPLGPYRSTDKGDTWTVQTAGLGQMPMRGFAVAPNGNVFVGGDGGVFRSTDVGISWRLVNNGLTANDVWFLESSPSGVLFAGTSNGTYRSTNSGDMWTLMSNGLSSYIPGFMGFLPSGSILLSANFNVYRSTDNGTSWSMVFQDYNFGALKSFAPDQNGNVYAIWGERILASTDDGVSWNERSRVVSSPRTLCANSAGHLFAAGAGGSFRSIDGGRNWELVHNASAGSNDMSAVINGSGYAYILNDLGQIYQSTNNGRLWTSAYSGSSGAVSRMRLDSTGRVYALIPQNTLSQSLESTVPGLVPNAFVETLSLGRQRISQPHDSALAVCNIGNGVLNISSVDVSDTMMSVRDAAFSVPPHTTYHDSIRYTPHTLGPGQVNIMVKHNAGVQPDTAHVSLVGFGMSRISFSVDTLRFGKIDIGAARDSIVMCRNVGDDTLRISGYQSSPASFFGSSVRAVTLPGGSFTDTVRFSPLASGPINGYLAFKTNTVFGGDTLPLSGAGTNVQAQVPSQIFDFGTLVLGQKKDTVVIIRNLGTDTLKTRSFTTPASFKAHPASWTISPGQSILDTIVFEPVTFGQFYGSIVVQYNGISSPAGILVRGYALDNKLLVVRPRSLEFGVVRLGDSSAATLSLVNGGADTIRFSGPNVPPYFRLGALPARLAPGESLQVSLVFKPLVYGRLPARLLIYSNTSSSPDQVSLNAMCADSARYSFTSRTIAFPTIVSGAFRDSAIVVSNTGPDTLRLLSTVSTNPYSFSYRPSKVKIPPFGTSVDTVRFSGAHIGPTSGQIYLVDNSSVTPETLFVSGTTKAVARIAISPRDLNFGDVEMESFKDTTVLIANSGDDTLHVSSIVSTNAMVSSLKGRIDLPPGWNYVDTVRFSPATADSLKNACLILTHNAGSGLDTIRVRGRGIPIYWRNVDFPFGYAFSLLINQRGDIFMGTAGRGIYRSSDNGISWEQVNAGLVGSPFVTVIHELTCSSSGMMFTVTMEDGVFRSTDNGNTWQKVSNGLRIPAVYTVGVNSAGVVFAGTNNFMTDSSGLYRSLDNGNSWAMLDIGVRNASITGIGFTRHGEMFCVAVGQGLYRSTDDGDTWSPVLPLPGSICVWKFIESNSGEIFASSSESGIYRSTDHGLSWKTSNSGIGNRGVYGLVSASDGSLFAGSWGGGVYRSTDQGNSWFSFNHGLKDTNVQAIARHPSDYLYVLNGAGLFRSINTIVASVVKDDPSHSGPPAEYSLEQNYPNPFNPSTTIDFSMASDARVSVAVYDVLGRQVDILVDKRLAAGRYVVQWSPRDLASGIYFVRMMTESYQAVKKLIYLR